MIANTHYGYVGKSKEPKFTYTGNYNVRDDGVVELLTSGTITFLSPAVIDIFCVGGGGAGTRRSPSQRGLGGGGGGYCQTLLKQAVTGSYDISIGNGGSVGNSGSATSFSTLVTASGGSPGGASQFYGGNGGSGGGGGVASANGYGAGGSDGSPGQDGNVSNSNGGTGQGVTTREFGEPTGKLYAGGGGGGKYMVGSGLHGAIGGAGGGGTGAWYYNKYNYAGATAGAANTGGGGGGGASAGTGNYVEGAPGGSGIVCFRAAK